MNKNNDLTVFNFDSNEIRTVDLDGQVWFVASDIAETLDYKDTEAMTRRLDDDEKQNLQIVGFGNRGATIISESGMYTAVLGSTKPEAKRFKKWVTSEVLPSIRKHGGYHVDKDMQLVIEMRQNFQEAKEAGLTEEHLLKSVLMPLQALLGERVARLLPKVYMNQDIATLTTSHQLAKHLNLTRPQLRYALNQLGLTSGWTGQLNPILTDKGKEHSVVFANYMSAKDFEVRWRPAVIEMVKEIAPDVRLKVMGAQAKITADITGEQLMRYETFCERNGVEYEEGVALLIDTYFREIVEP